MIIAGVIRLVSALAIGSSISATVYFLVA